MGKKEILIYLVLCALSLNLLTNFIYMQDTGGEIPLASPKGASAHVVVTSSSFLTYWEVQGEYAYQSRNHQASATFSMEDTATQITASVTTGSSMTYTTWINMTRDFGKANQTSTKYPVSVGTPVIIPNGTAGFVVECYMTFHYNYIKCVSPPFGEYCYDTGLASASGTAVNYLIGIQPLAPRVKSYRIDEECPEMVNGKYDRPLLLETQDPNESAIGLSFWNRVHVYYQEGPHDLSNFTNPTFLCDAEISYYTLSRWNDTTHSQEYTNGFYVKITRSLWEPLPQKITYGVVFTNDVGGESAAALIYVDVTDNGWIRYVVGFAMAGALSCLAVIVIRKKRQANRAFRRKYMEDHPLHLD